MTKLLMSVQVWVCCAQRWDCHRCGAQNPQGRDPSQKTFTKKQLVYDLTVICAVGAGMGLWCMAMGQSQMWRAKD